MIWIGSPGAAWPIRKVRNVTAKSTKIRPKKRLTRNTIIVAPERRKARRTRPRPSSFPNQSRNGDVRPIGRREQVTAAKSGQLQSMHRRLDQDVRAAPQHHDPARLIEHDRLRLLIFFVASGAVMRHHIRLLGEGVKLSITVKAIVGPSPCLPDQAEEVVGIG